jgi:hypothetical protein
VARELPTAWRVATRGLNRSQARVSQTFTSSSARSRRRRLASDANRDGLYFTRRCASSKYTGRAVTPRLMWSTDSATFLAAAKAQALSARTGPIAQRHPLRSCARWWDRPRPLATANSEQWLF